VGNYVNMTFVIGALVPWWRPEALKIYRDN
jgi:hypothetical protein